MIAQEGTRGLVRGAAVAFVLLVLIPGVVFLLPSDRPGADMFGGFSLFATLALFTYASIYPALWMHDLSWSSRIAFTLIEVLMFMGAFGWLTRQEPLRTQVMYGLIGLGAILFLIPTVGGLLV